jgi:hypothetical protein
LEAHWPDVPPVLEDDGADTGILKPRIVHGTAGRFQPGRRVRV